MRLHTVKIDNVKGCNITVGLASSIEITQQIQHLFFGKLAPIDFGLAYYDASESVVRLAGTDDALMTMAHQNVSEMAIADLFFLVSHSDDDKVVLQYLRELPAIRKIHVSSCRVIEIILAESDGVRDVMGVADDHVVTLQSAPVHIARLPKSFGHKILELRRYITSNPRLSVKK